jgi:hypothetical protein
LQNDDPEKANAASVSSVTNEPRPSNETLDPNEGCGGKATMPGLLDGIGSFRQRIAAK